jgi:thioredoxin reductase (NADPH)
VCRKVTIVQNLPFFTGEQKLAEALATKENVEVRFSTLVSGYLQENGELKGLVLKNENGEESTISVDGAFLAVGLKPENEAFAQLVALDERGYFDADEHCLTKTAGVFVAGDCRRKNIRQVATAAADGAIAAMAACRYLEQ